MWTQDRHISRVRMIMSDLTYNQRQYKLMLLSLDAYEEGSISLDTLTGNLGFLLNALEGKSSEWEDSFRTACISLEMANLNPSYYKIPLTSQDLQTIAEAIVELRTLIRAADPSMS